MLTKRGRGRARAGTRAVEGERYADKLDVVVVAAHRHFERAGLRMHRAT